ncbi:hypothetical protein K6I34_003646, partial [Streptomyces sp. UNOC14_S4]|nr:hypothetical protein [Streptomyces sp. UNOC14_S4]
PPSQPSADEMPVPDQEGGTAPASVPPPVCTVPAPLVERGAQILAAVSHGERRLRLTGREVTALAPLAGDWLQRGATATDIREALTQWLPEPVRSPAGLVRDRLTRKCPEAPTLAEQRAAEQKATAARSGPRVAEMRECAGDHVQPRLFRPAADEVLCRECRCHAAERAEETSRAVAAARRGAAAARAALRGTAQASA